MEPFLGQIQAFGFNFPPRGWAQCNGQLLPISQNTALFSLLGTTYGGDGRTTFGLPELRGRVPLHYGTGPGLSTYQMGQRGGTETEVLLLAHTPSHTHPLNATTEAATDFKNGGKKLASSQIYSATGPDVALHGSSIGQGGGSSIGHNNLAPYLVVNWCIATIGLFPSRN